MKWDGTVSAQSVEPTSTVGWVVAVEETFCMELNCLSVIVVVGGARLKVEEL